MERIGQIILAVADFLWGWPLLILLIGTHLFLTFRLRFVQRYLWSGIKLSVTPDKESSGDISQLGALSTALASTVGSGNIVGVATAISLGGPGAVFWIWMTGVFGIATKYAEALLSMLYRTKNAKGEMVGGPMYVLEKGLNCKWLAILFAVFTILASYGIGSSIQSNAIANAVSRSFSIPPIISGILVCILVGISILGGIKGIARICNGLIPLMILFYIAGCGVILIVGHETLWDSIKLIFSSAFTAQAGVGGFAGSTVMMAMRYGVARGLFSNESGLGSAPIVAAAARSKNPVRQALVSASGTFWDTVIICALTGVVLVNSGAWTSGEKGVQMTQAAFSYFNYGDIFLSISIIAFTFSTILGWSFYAEKAVEYIFPQKKAIVAYRLTFLVAVFFGAVFSLDVVWGLGDIFNGLMAIPNLISLLLLNKIILKQTRFYLWEKNLDHEHKV